MSYYNHSLDLPYSKVTIKFRELTTNEQLILAKTNLILNYDLDGFYEYYNFLIDIIKTIIKPDIDILNLDIIEFVMFITKLRTISIGNNIEFFLENKEDPDIKKQKITLNLNYFIKSLYEVSNSFFENENNKIIDKNISVILKYPTLKNINSFGKTESYNDINETIMEFIDEVIINEFKVKFSNFEKAQKQEFLDKFPINIKQKIEMKIFDMLTKLVNQNLFGVEYFKDQKFSIYGFGFMSFLKIFFSYDVKSLYSEIHYLSSNGLNPDYVLSISPSERKIYISIINEINKSKSQSPQSGWADLVNNDKTAQI
jgi:hypothetical protein